MVTTAEVRNPVAPPEVRPRLHGLTTTFQPRNLETHDRLGVTWPGSGACGGVVSTTDDACLAGESQEALELVNACLARGTADRITVYSFVSSSIFDTLSQDPAAASDPQSAFAHAEAPAIEAAYWAMAMTGADDAGAAGSLLEALAEVEQHLAENYNGLGVIHLTPRAAVLLGDDGLVRPSGVLTTRTGTPVVIGAGYDGDDGLTVLGTGVPVLFRTGAPSRIDTYGLSFNEATVLTQRPWLLGYDCVSVKSTFTPT